MARSVLGKRARSSRELETDLPIHHAKRQTRSSRVNDENVEPNAITTIEERFQEVDTAEITEDSVASTPSLDNTPFELVSSRKHTEYKPITPSTPRFRDALAKVPVTPRHRVMSAGRISKRSTPQTLTPTAVQTVYHLARQLFSRSADPGTLIGRDAERKQLRSFLDRCAKTQPGGCLYVSGPPGTGKSAMVNEMTEEAAQTFSVKKAYINCMSIKSSKDLYATLWDLLFGDSVIAEADVAMALEKLFLPKKKTSDAYLIVLDEIDHILTLDLESLYRVFEWSLQKSSRLILVGIANALDLTDRFLPRLKSRNLKPELLPFLPYSAAQIKTIITTRLKSLVAEDAPLPFFHPAAIELCSRKVSSQTGDLRKAFEICRRAIDLVEMETRQKHEAEVKENILLATPSRKVLGENANLSSPRGHAEKNVSAAVISSLKSLTIENAPRVSIGHLNKITAAAFSNGTTQRLKTLNLQQKAALCSLVALEKRNRVTNASISITPSKSQSTAPSVKTLYDTYCRLCTEDSVLHPLSSSEFREVMSSLETLSLVASVDGKMGSFNAPQTPSKRGRRNLFNTTGLVDEKRVASCVGEKEMEQATEGIGAGILQSILSGDALV
ncbi:cell division control protein 18 [Xylariales sp. PMI_506]|nr:cell division control protein 18 [Xylariales sp. PMI_506]